MIPTKEIFSHKQKIAQLEDEIKQMENIKGSPIEQWTTLIKTPAAKSDFVIPFAKELFPWGENFEMQNETLIITANNFRIKLPLHTRNNLIVITYANTRPENPYRVDKLRATATKYKNIGTAIQNNNFSEIRKNLFEGSGPISAYLAWFFSPAKCKVPLYWFEKASEVEELLLDFSAVNRKHRIAQERDEHYFLKDTLPMLKEFAEGTFDIEFA